MELCSSDNHYTTAPRTHLLTSTTNRQSIATTFDKLQTKSCIEGNIRIWYWIKHFTLCSSSQRHWWGTSKSALPLYIPRTKEVALVRDSVPNFLLYATLQLITYNNNIHWNCGSNSASYNWMKESPKLLDNYLACPWRLPRHIKETDKMLCVKGKSPHKFKCCFEGTEVCLGPYQTTIVQDFARKRLWRSWKVFRNDEVLREPNRKYLFS